MLNRLLTVLGGRRQETTGPSGDDSTAKTLVRSGSRTASSPSPEEVVVQLLREADGCLKQQSVIERTDWGPSKVSRTLTDMEEHGHVTRIRIGREKIVCLPDEVPKSLHRERDELIA